MRISLCCCKSRAIGKGGAGAGFGWQGRRMDWILRGKPDLSAITPASTLDVESLMHQRHDMAHRREGRGVEGRGWWRRLSHSCGFTLVAPRISTQAVHLLCSLFPPKGIPPVYIVPVPPLPLSHDHTTPFRQSIAGTRYPVK